MLIALDSLNHRIRASPNHKAKCPECLADVIPKCGNINIWHWAHSFQSNCTYGTGISDWHLKLQNYALDHDADVEVRLEDTIQSKKLRIADIMYKKRIIELQHSGITQEEILNRSNDYNKLHFKVDWIVDYRKNYFKHVQLRYILADGHHKKVYDILCNKQYGSLIFDISTDHSFLFFVVKQLIIKKTYIDSGWGIRTKKIYEFYGYTTTDFLEPYTNALRLTNIINKTQT